MKENANKRGWEKAATVTTVIRNIALISVLVYQFIPWAYEMVAPYLEAWTPIIKWWWIIFMM